MDKKEITEKLKPIIKPYVQNEEAFEKLTGETDLLKDLQINSGHLVDIILDVEEAFDIEIDDERAESMLSVQASIDVIHELVNA